jgi:hypothetical protein
VYSVSKIAKSLLTGSKLAATGGALAWRVAPPRAKGVGASGGRRVVHSVSKMAKRLLTGAQLGTILPALAAAVAPPLGLVKAASDWRAVVHGVRKVAKSMLTGAWPPPMSLTTGPDPRSFRFPPSRSGSGFSFVLFQPYFYSGTSAECPSEDSSCVGGSNGRGLLVTRPLQLPAAARPCGAVASGSGTGPGGPLRQDKCAWAISEWSRSGPGTDPSAYR